MEQSLSASSIALLLAQEKKKRNWTIAVVMLLCVSVLVTVSSQLSNKAFTDSSMRFHAPFFFLIIKECFRIFTFPVYLLISTVTRKCRGRPIHLRKTVRHCMNVVGGEWTCKSATITFVPSAITLLLAQIGWVLGLANLPASIATAILCTAVAISYIFTCCFLKQPFFLVKGAFVCVAFAGVGLNAYGQLEHHMNRSSVIGISATVVAAFANALHLLAFKKAFPELDLGQTSFVVSCLFLFNCLMLWPVPLVLELTHLESFDSSLMPWGVLMGAWICSSLAAIATGYGLVVSTPFFMSIAELLILVANSVVDVVVRHLKTHLAQIIGIVLIGVAFMVLIIPDEYLMMNSKKRKSEPSASSSPSRLSEAGSDEESSSKHLDATDVSKKDLSLKPSTSKVRPTKSDQNVPGNESIAAPQH